MPNATDVETWSFGALLWAHRHLLCCSPETGSCNLRAVDMERIRRTMPADWAAFQLASHARADVLNAQAELWPVTRGLGWENLSDEAVRALPTLPASLWCLIIRGPDSQTDRTPLPSNQAPRSRFGFVTEHDCERITRHSWKTIQANMSDAIRQMLRVLNGPDTKYQEPQDIRYFACSPRRHVFAIGGTPHPDGRCWCLRVTYSDWLRKQAG